jgi:hypothetical protein
MSKVMEIGASRKEGENIKNSWNELADLAEIL